MFGWLLQTIFLTFVGLVFLGVLYELIGQKRTYAVFTNCNINEIKKSGIFEVEQIKLKDVDPHLVSHISDQVKKYPNLELNFVKVKSSINFANFVDTKKIDGSDPMMFSFRGLNFSQREHQWLESKGVAVYRLWHNTPQELNCIDLKQSEMNFSDLFEVIKISMFDVTKVSYSRIKNSEVCFDLKKYDYYDGIALFLSFLCGRRSNLDDYKSIYSDLCQKSKNDIAVAFEKKFNSVD